MVRDSSGKLYALLTTCTHLGCLTGFFPAEGLFKCPCHGSNFSLPGDPVAGPARCRCFTWRCHSERMGRSSSTRIVAKIARPAR